MFRNTTTRCTRGFEHGRHVVLVLQRRGCLLERSVLLLASLVSVPKQVTQLDLAMAANPLVRDVTFLDQTNQRRSADPEDVGRLLGGEGHCHGSDCDGETSIEGFGRLSNHPVKLDWQFHSLAALFLEEVPRLTTHWSRAGRDKSNELFEVLAVIWQIGLFLKF